LCLPVFMGMVFMIMEIGYIAFRTILLNHATYEAVRVGGMTYSLPSVGGDSKAQAVMARFYPSGQVQLVCFEKPTIPDNQAGITNGDLYCKATETLQLIFPISSIVFANPRGSGKRQLVAEIRMPIERPLSK
ncbi:MAG: TadE/TadG family type IV pilus assembly protein, partial [Elusimicrobiota bacterium]